jgi:hypothetical protein
MTRGYLPCEDDVVLGVVGAAGGVAVVLLSLVAEGRLVLSDEDDDEEEGVLMLLSELEGAEDGAAVLLLASELVLDEEEAPCDAVCAAWVFGPMMPSIGPGSKPLSFSDCCSWRTESVPALVLLDDEAPWSDVVAD